eukprot:jgi/Astpho2/5942/fgenesh1_pg.00080_%23_134_t
MMVCRCFVVATVKLLAAVDRRKATKMTLGETEEAEGGTVLESRVAMAQAKRNQKRKNKKAGESTEWVADEEAEELAGQDEDEGIKLTAFNMAEERADGYFDEGGHYVENKKDDEEEKDAWLASGEGGAVVSNTVRQRVEEQRRKMAAAEEAPEMTLRQECELKGTVAAILQPGETVTAALKRLGGQRQQRTRGGKAGKQPRAPPTEAELAAREQLDRLTEAASALMDSGELDVYSKRQDLFAREAAAYRKQGFANDDMFADDEDAEPQQGPAPASGARQQQRQPAQAGPGASNGTNSGSLKALPTSQAAAAPAKVDYATWPIKELRRFLTQRSMVSALVKPSCSDKCMLHSSSCVP